MRHYIDLHLRAQNYDGQYLVFDIQWRSNGQTPSAHRAYLYLDGVAAQAGGYMTLADARKAASELCADKGGARSGLSWVAL